MADNAPKLGGAERAAVVLMTLGEDAAATVLRHMGPKEVQALSGAMASLATLSRAQVEQVLGEFVQQLGQSSPIGVDAEHYARRVLVQALGEDKAQSLLNRARLGSVAGGLEALKWMEPRAVADLIRDEHPQVAAIVLCHLDPEQSGQVLALLPARMRADVLMRVSTLDAVRPAAIEELNRMLERQVSDATQRASTTIGGIKSAAEMLNFVGGGAEGEILEAIKDVDAELSERLQDAMFVFENLIDVEDAGIQALLREVSSESLLIALKGADEGIREKFFRNMSKRAAEMLRDDLDAKGPVRLSDVEAAQKEIVGIARRMAEEGQIALGGRSSEAYV